MEKIKTIIIDDDIFIHAQLREQLLLLFPKIQVVAVCENALHGIEAIKSHRPDLIFLDIQMPKITGFEMLELIEEPPAVIFTTAFDTYALKAFEAHAVDYLLKPFSKERFETAVNKYLSATDKTKTLNATNEILQSTNKHSEEQNRVVVKFGGNIRILNAGEIFYIEAYDDYVKIFTKDDYFLKKKTMSYFEDTLSKNDFLRVHRSYIVQLQQITKIEPFEKGNHVALLKNGKTIPLSRTGYSALKDKLGL